MLCDQSMVKIASIYTQHGPISVDEQRSRLYGQLEFKAVKTSEFDAIYAEHARVNSVLQTAREACEASEPEELDASTGLNSTSFPL
ncbi:unspecified product [Leishmania tarentolae]|uniref:Unspecified product n=1 Tax=Leishmania tarentolae TaxID=5689 RepID=A0A640KBV5_LEITA|nr:unspecified product [Leishmania tarentolae]